MKKTFLLKVLALIFALCTVTCIFTACKNDGGSSEVNGECAHDWQEATCLSAKTCKECGAVEGLALDHSWGEWFETELATCQTEGEKRRNCERCGYYETRMIFVIDHNFVEGYCSMCGAIDENYHEHSWQEADCLTPKTCSICGATEGGVLDHSFVDNVCENCGLKEATANKYFNFELLEDGTYSISAKSVNNMPAEVILPSIYKGKAVTSISDYAFSECSSLTSLEIPNSVTSISERAFYFCRSLNEVNYLGSIDNWVEIEFSGFYANPLYYANQLKINGEVVTEVNLTTATSIGNYAFYDNSSLTTVVIGDSVTSIGDYAFDDCSSLTTVVIGNSVTSIGRAAFSDCSSLTSVEISDSVNSIDSYAFHYCSSLTSVVIGDFVTSIGYAAFYACRSLISVVIGNSVTSIGALAFENCSSLTSIVLPNSVTHIGLEAFYNSSLTSIVIPDSIISICYATFDSCSSLQYNVKDNLKYLGNELNPYLYLAGVTSLDITSASIDSNCRVIGAGAFEDCSSLTSVVIPDSVISICDGAFNNCSSLTSIEIPNSVISIDDFVFSDCSSLQYNVKDNLKYLGNESNPYLYLAGVTSLGITSVNIDSNCKFIAYRAFNNCSSLTSVEIPNSVISIGNYVFHYCRSLTSVVIGDSVTSIGNLQFFEAGRNLTSIVIPNSVTYIGEGAFKYCSSLTIYCRVESQPTEWSVYWNQDNRPVIWGYES